MSQYKTLNIIKIKRSSLIHNYRYFQKLHPHSAIAPVLKSNAYGHGLRLLGKYIDQELKTPYICVDSLYEAYELQKEKVKTRILIMGYTFPDNFKTWRRLKFSLPVYDLDTLAAINKYQPNAKIHLKIDSGMNRLGIQPQQIPDFIKELKKHNKLTVEGIFSHLSKADDPKKSNFTKKQIKAFKETIASFEKAGYFFRWKHISATAGAMTIQDPDFNLIRLGLGLYGISPLTNNPHNQKLKPVLSLQTHIAQVKKIGKGSEVSYGGTFKAKHDMTIGILPIGYYDGLDRRLSNKGKVLINGESCPILGRVCMNITIVDLTHIKNPTTGQAVTVFSSDPSAPNSVLHSAKLSKTIPYTLLTGLASSTRRILI